jgi:hypothetical protein
MRNGKLGEWFVAKSDLLSVAHAAQTNISQERPLERSLAL